MMSLGKKTRRALALAFGVALAAGACSTVDQLLEADNPGAIDESQLNDAALVNVLTNSVIGALGAWYDDPFIWRGSMFTDEQITGVNWEATARLSQRIVDDGGDANGMFAGASRYRFIADSAAGRFRQLLENPQSDERMALVLAHSGYAYIMMAEVMCEASLNVGSELYTPVQLANFAIPRFEEAITVAGAANRADIANLARVGLARAALLTGDKARVMSAAGAVTNDEFAWWVEYNQVVSDNVMYVGVTGANHRIGVHPHFLAGPFGEQALVAGQTDPRVQHTPNWTLGHNALTKLYKPFQSLAYSGFNGETQADGGKPILYEQGTDIKLASYLEAMHHYYEAAGPSGTGPEGTTLEFVNARRAFGNQAPVNVAGDALMAELREQRGRDLYLGGFRLGDLRRWKDQGVGDFFPTGTHPTVEWGAYGPATCYPLPLTEKNGNPNLGR